MLDIGCATTTHLPRRADMRCGGKIYRVQDMMPKTVKEVFYEAWGLTPAGGDGFAIESAPVLATDGKIWQVAYTQQDIDYYGKEEEEARWVVAGRDGYHFDNVTHWAKLPHLSQLPK